MAIRLASLLSAKHILRRSATSMDVPKGYFAVYVGEGEKKRFMIPVAYLKRVIISRLVGSSQGRILI